MPDEQPNAVFSDTAELELRGRLVDLEARLRLLAQSQLALCLTVGLLLHLLWRQMRA